jgi:hypothetical protein
MFKIVYHEKDEHDRFEEAMPSPPVLVLEDLPWTDPLSDDPEEDRRLRQKQVAAANAAYYRQVLAEYHKTHPTLWMRVLHCWQRIRQG